MTCTGGSDICGGGAHITVWQNKGTVTVPGHDTVGAWTGKGCFVSVKKWNKGTAANTLNSDSIANRALPNQVYVDGAMTVEKCTSKCLDGGFKYAGVEYGSVRVFNPSLCL